MGLSNDIVSQFAKATKVTSSKSTETTYFATVVEYNGGYYAKLDGSEQLTPVLTTADIVPGERVTVLVKDHTATVTGNISSPSARQSSVVELDGKVSQFGTILADKVDTVTLRAEQARIDALYAENATITGTLTAQDASIKNLETENITIKGRLDVNEASITNLEVNKLDASTASLTYATIEKLDATNANITSLTSDFGSFKSLTASEFAALEADIVDLDTKKLSADEADIKFATIDNLNAAKADIEILDADVADINTLIFGSASGSSIQTSFANAVIAQLGNAQIKSAMIESVTASKITAGDIITNNVRVKSEDGSLIISDETLQISDWTRVRVQIGKDASNDYSINVWDASGNLMFSKGGITDSAIKSAIIRNDMVSDTANISAHKLNIDTLFEAINDDGSNTLKATKIYLDDESQTLEVAFKNMTTTVSSTTQTANNALSTANTANSKANTNASNISTLTATTSSQGTQISAIQGQISSKIWQEDITTAVDGIEIGGRNLARKTSTSHTWQSTSNYGNDTWKGSDGGTNWLPYIEIEAEQDYTLSFDYTLENVPDSEKNSIGCGIGSGTGNDYNADLWTSIAPFIDYGGSSSAGKFVYYLKAKSLTTKKYFAFRPMRRGGTDTLTTPIIITISNFKLEKGNKATDWTPAPEDLASEADVTTLNTQYSELSQDLDSITATVAQHTTQISNKADNSTVTTVSNKVTEVETNLNGFKTTVSNTYATKTALASTDSNVTSLISRISSAETSIKQNTTDITLRATKTELATVSSAASAAQSTADSVKTNLANNYYTKTQNDSNLSVKANEILSSVSSTYVTNDTFNSLEIGGRNLLRNSNFSDGTNYWVSVNTNTSVITDDAYDHALSFYTTSAGSDNYRIYYGTNYFSHVAGTTYTLSFYAKSSSVTTVQSNVAASLNNKNYSLSTTWQRYTHTYTASATGSLTFWPNTANVTIYLTNIKLEKGNKATDWAPAPEDLASEADLESLTTRVTESESNITQLSNRITAEVSERSTLATRVSTVEQTASSLTVQLNSINTVANTALLNTNLTQDVTNFAQLNDDTASKWGFTADDTADGHWYTINTLSRDKTISQYHSCSGGERFRITYEISTSCKGNSTIGGTDSTYRGTAIGLYTFDATEKTTCGIRYSDRITATADAPITSVSSVVTLPSSARRFYVFVQTESWGNFSGTIKVRNVRVEKIDAVLESAIAVNTNSIEAAVSRVSANESDIATLKVTANNLNISLTSTTATANSALSAANAAQSDIDNLEIGGRNLFGFCKDVSVYALGNISTVVSNRDDYGITVTSKSDTSGNLLRIQNLGFNGTKAYEPYTFSAIMYATSTCKVTLDICDANYTSVTLSETPQKVSFTAYPGGYYTSASYNGFFDMAGAVSTGIIIYLKNIKIERGTKATDFTPAPEDVEEAIIDSADEIRGELITQSTNIEASCNEIILSALESYVKTDEYESYKESVSSSFEQTASDIEIGFAKTEESISELDSDVQTKFTQMYKYFTFTDNGLEISAGDNVMSLVLDNDMISFQKNGTQFGWWDGIDFHTGNIVVDVDERAQFGNFAFVPRSDGSLSFLKVGD